MSYINDNAQFARLATFWGTVAAFASMLTTGFLIWPLLAVAAAAYGLFGLCKGFADNDHTRDW